jgi:hypothetical protein
MLAAAFVMQFSNDGVVFPKHDRTKVLAATLSPTTSALLPLTACTLANPCVE